MAADGGDIESLFQAAFMASGTFPTTSLRDIEGPVVQASIALTLVEQVQYD